VSVGKRNIFLSNTAETMSYSSDQKRGKTPYYPERDRLTHAERIQKKLQEAYGKDAEQKRAVTIRHKDGVYLEFSSASNYDLKFDSLENLQQGIRLLNVKEDHTTQTVKATVYVPSGKESYFIKKVEAYASEQTSKGNPKNKDLVNSIEDVKLAFVDSFWVGDQKNLPNSNPVWCEVWLRFDYNCKNPDTWRESEDNFVDICNQHRIKVNDENVIFPERIVKLIFANLEDLKVIISACPYIAEIRRAEEPTSFFMDLSNFEQQQWVEELLARVQFHDNNWLSACWTQAYTHLILC
jgi:hypothetical protein